MKIQRLFYTVVIILTSFSSYSQLQVFSNGKLKVGGGTANNAARLNISDSDNSTIFSKCYFTYGWGDAIKSEVDVSDGIAYSAYYNGNRNFMVFGDGDVWSATNVYTSDSTLKYNIENVKNSVEVIKQLRGVTYFKKDDEKEIKQKHSGLLAQEVEKVLPDIVYETDKGIKGIAYIEIIPYLIEAIKIQQQIIDDQEGRIKDIEANCCNNDLKNKSAIITIGNNGEVRIPEAKLYQNQPNPFTNETTIRFEIPQTVGSAQLYICNMTGTLLKTITVNQRGTGSIKINGNDLTAGMYLYSLVTDGKIIDTKQMLLTE